MAVNSSAAALDQQRRAAHRPLRILVIVLGPLWDSAVVLDRVTAATGIGWSAHPSEPARLRWHGTWRASWSGRVPDRRSMPASQPEVEPDGKIPEDGRDAGDDQVGERERWGAEQITERWQ